MINVIARPKPHSAELVTWREAPGQTIADMLGGVLDDVEVFLGDGREVLDVPLEELVTQWQVPHDRWHRVKPKTGVSVYAVKVSQDSDIMQIILPIAVGALAFVAPYAAAWAAPSVFGAGGSAALVGASGGLTFAGSAVSAAVGILGSVALNALIQPQMPTVDGQQESFTRLASVTGQSNTMNPFGVIPRLYGTHVIYPMIPMTARPYTELVGDTQYLRWKGVLGQGPLEIGGVKCGRRPGYGGFSHITEKTALSGDPIKIGNTPITEFEGVQFRIGDSRWTGTRQLYKDQVLEEKVGANLNLQKSYQRRTWLADNVSVTRTTDPDAEEIGLDILFPQGLFSVYNEGGTAGARVQWVIEYREVGTSAWTRLTPADSPSIENGWLDKVTRDDATQTFTRTYYRGRDRETYTETYSEVDKWRITEGEWRLVTYNNERKTFRVGVTWDVPKGQYDVRLTRVRSLGGGGAAYRGDATWTVLRAYRDRKAFHMDGIVAFDLRLPITDQISGQLDQVSVVATSVLPYHDGSAWQYPGAATDNPAWIYADIWAGLDSARPVPESMLNASALKTWADDNTAAGRGYNKVIDTGGTVLQRAREVASTGRAAFALHDNQVSVVRDQADAEPLVTVSPRNAWDFTEVFTAPDLPHALRVTFTDPNTWEKTERFVYRDGYNADGSDGKTAASKFETYETQGVTSAQQAWEEGRLVLAERELRPVQQSFVQGLLSVIYERGDAIELQYDVIGVGLQPGRIKTVSRNADGDVTAFESDERLFMEAGQSYGVKIQIWDPDTDAPALRMATIQTDSSSDGVTQVVLDSALSDVEVGAHFVFGEATRESATMKVLNIKRRNEHHARITVVPAAPEIQDALTGEVPPWNPQITQPVDPSKLRPPAPEISEVVSDESALIQRRDGSLDVRMVVAYALQPGQDIGSVQMRFRRAAAAGDIDTDYETKGWIWKAPQDPVGEITDTRVEEGKTYEIQIRGWGRAARQWSAWSPSTTHTIVGKTSLPPPVENVQVERLANGAHEVTFDYPDEPLDWKGISLLIDGAFYRFYGGQPKAITIPPDRLATPGTYALQVVPVDTSNNGGAAEVVTIERPAPPPIDELLTEELADGTRRFTWRYSAAPIDLVGVQLRAKVGRSTAWTTATPLHSGALREGPFETRALRAGTWTVMARGVDTLGNVSRESAIAVLGLGDRLVNNVVDLFDCRADGWPGQIVGGSVQPDGALLADSTNDAFWADWVTPFWTEDDEPFWTAPSDAFWSADEQPFWTDDADGFWTGDYPGVTYTRWNMTPDFGGLLTIDFEGRGDADILYRRRLPEAFWTADDQPFWTDDSAPFWRPAQQFLRYTGPVQLAREPFDVRVVTPSGLTQAELRRLRVIVDAPDVIERFNDVAIAASGTRLALSKQFRAVKHIQITLQDDGGAAAGARYADKESDPGPLIQVTDASGTPTAGTVDVTVQGI